MLESGLVDVKENMILDGSFVEAMRQRNTRDENKAIKDGRGNEPWIDHPAKKRQKAVEGRISKPTTAT